MESTQNPPLSLAFRLCFRFKKKKTTQKTVNYKDRGTPSGHGSNYDAEADERCSFFFSFFLTSCPHQAGLSNPIRGVFPLSIISSWLAHPLISSCVFLFPFAKLIEPDNSFRPMRRGSRPPLPLPPSPRLEETTSSSTSALLCHFPASRRQFC